MFMANNDPSTKDRAKDKSAPNSRRDVVRQGASLSMIGFLRRYPWLLPVSLLILIGFYAGSEWISSRTISQGQADQSPWASATYDDTDAPLVHLPTTLPAFALQDQNGASVSKADLLGHPAVVDFIYTECSGVCPVLNREMVDLEKDPAYANTRFVSFSVGTDDGPPTLKRYLANYPDADEMRWRILAADDQFMPAVAVSLGLANSVKQVREGFLPYSSGLFLVDADGIVRSVYHGQQPDEVQRLKDDLRRMTSPATQPATQPAGQSAAANATSSTQAAF
jgi:protein SCO1/2